MKHFKVEITTGAGVVPVHIQAYSKDHVTEVCASFLSGCYGSDWLIHSITEINPQIDKNKALEAFMGILCTQSFYDWYENVFSNYIQAQPDCKNKEEILNDLMKKFNLAYLFVN